MKRTNRKLWLAFGIAGAVASAFIFPNTRSLIVGFVETQYVEWRLLQLHPQNKEELYSAYRVALKLEERHWSAFRVNDIAALDRWTHDARGNLKPWVSPDDYALYRLSFKSGLGDDELTVFSTGHKADFTLHYHPLQMWAEGVASVGAGILAGCTGGFLLYLLLAVLIIYAMLLGKGLQHRFAPTTQQEVVHVHNPHGGDGTHTTNRVDHAAEEAPVTWWPIVTAIAFVVVLLDARVSMSRVATMSSRASPSPRRRAAMLRIIALSLVCLFLLIPAYPAHAGDAVSFFFGEMPAATGSAAELTLGSGPVIVFPWATLDGSKFEGLVMGQHADSALKVAVGPLVGSTNNSATGATLYFGAEVRGSFRYRAASLVFRLAERHTRETRMSRFANVGIEWSRDSSSVRLSYQPIARSASWEHRIAMRVQVPYKKLRLAVEVRTTLDAHHRKGALAEVRLPILK
ncbi:MAG: hypothetical protein V1907_05070 [Candidatus Kerfeldbacteria bacterium]